MVKEDMVMKKERLGKKKKKEDFIKRIRDECSIVEFYKLKEMILQVLEDKLKINDRGK